MFFSCTLMVDRSLSELPISEVGPHCPVQGTELRPTCFPKDCP